MNTEQFWSLIDETRQRSAGDAEKQHGLLIEALYGLSSEDIQEFDRLLWMKMVEAYRADLWDAVWLIGCGCGDEAFEAFCGWLIMQGQSIYEKILEDPENLADIVPKEERFDFIKVWMLNVTTLAYERKTDQPIPETRYREWPILAGGALLSEDELPAKFPRIIAKIGGCDDEALFD